MILKQIIKKLLQLSFYRLLHNSRIKITLPTNNHKFLVPDDLIWAYANGDYYEKNVIYFFDQIIKSYKNPVLHDIGANCGYYSLRYSTNCKQIFSFEPVSTTFKHLKKNIDNNTISNIIPLKFGLAENNESKTINLYSSSGNNSIFDRKIPHNHPLKKVGTEMIVLRKLDSLIESGELTIPDIIKIDVEGAELAVLKGAKKTINLHRPTILLEYSENTSNDAGYSKARLLNVLELTDYHIYGIPEDENNCALIKWGDLDKFASENLIFIPAELDTYLKHAAD